ncbi:MAG TPA: Tad domain-containing protein [Humisphaera sp.]
MSGSWTRTGHGRGTRRAGGLLVWSVLAMVAMIGFASLAVDLGRVQMVKTDLQRQADAAARGSLAIYDAYDLPTAQSYGPWLGNQAYNPVDATTGVAPTVTITWGYWVPATSTFYAGTNSSYPTAVRCVSSRTAANGNAVPLTWAKVLGRPWQDVTCTSVAIMTNTTSAAVSTPSTSDVYLAGMPAGSTASLDDTTTNAAAYQVTSVPVVPGSYLSFNSVTGAVGHTPTGPQFTADGDATTMFQHCAGGGGPTGGENGVADVTMPRCAFLGLFLGATAPNTSAAPDARDYTTAASRDQASYDDIELKQPFFIGDGLTSGGAVQVFRVPAGATRLYLGVMDGYQWNNNAGSFAATVKLQRSIQVVR